MKSLAMVLIAVAATSCAHPRITQQDIDDYTLEVVLNENISSSFKVVSAERICGLSIYLQVLDPNALKKGMRLYANLLTKDGQPIESMARAFYSLNEEAKTAYVNIRDFDEMGHTIKTIELIGDWDEKRTEQGH